MPELRDDPLFQGLVDTYKTFILFDYNTARDTLFSKIDAVNDSLECIYTGLKLYLPPDQDPTIAVFLNGVPNGINTEHVYPEGKGASGFGRSDMHHLYPSRVKTNSDRANNPFGEIPDAQTKIWYLKTTELSFPPTVNRDLYSESTPTKFEPRESVKGNIARSVFYFYTMYRQESNNSDPNFFGIQLADLCDWQFTDPVDETEWNRTHKIATYQGGKTNPFVLDCSLAARLYCNNISQECEQLILASTENPESEEEIISIFPNPAYDQINIRLENNHAGIYTLSIMDIYGKKRNLIFHGKLDIGNHVWQINSDFPGGLYTVVATEPESRRMIIRKFVKVD
ncbi:MAG: endonuclease [Saprospiraceae bacterium]|nr:endonuclease [Saprospiraceae bacterium]